MCLPKRNYTVIDYTVIVYEYVEGKTTRSLM